MSNTIDERVVEMRFDNRDFERNVATSMSTLEKLKQKLHLTGASKGLENLNSAAKKVDFAPISNNFDKMAVRFSHTQATIQHQLDRWVDRIVNTGERMVKALTIDPVKTGFQEYETQMNAVQTILANTQSKGSTLNDVNKALDELNTYADKTIYNFTEMTRNIGTFTAAGVDLDTSVNAIQGIANLAAISGSTSQQASTAMYQLSQALASGTVKLMDWNSVVNAGMGGQVFQDALKETARIHGVAIDSMIEEQGSFRETLSEGWLTSEILTETLQKFTLTTEGLTEEQIKANREMLKAKGYTDAQIDEIFKLGNTATQAATKVKTFTQLWDVLKESAQSGWSQTWKLIIGDFEQAKSLLSPLADFLTGAIGKMSDFRNLILQKALDNPFTDLLDKINDVTSATEAVTNATKDYAGIVKKVMGGEYGNGQSRWDKLTEEGYDWTKVQNMVNEELGCSVRHTEKLADAQGKQSEAQKNSARAQSYSLGTLVKFSDAQLRAMGYTTENINALRTLEKQSERTGIPIEELAEDINLLSGRSLLINSFKNAGKGLVKVFQAMKGAWADVFPDTMNIDKMASALYDFLAAMHKFSTNLIMTDETADKLRRTLAGVFAIIDLVTTVLGGGFKIAFKVVRSILQYFDMDLLGLTANIGDAIVKFNNWVNSLFDVSGLLDFIIPLLKTGAKTVAGWIDSFKNLPIVQKFVSKIKMAFDSLKDMDFKEIGKNIIDGFKNGLGDGIDTIVNYVVEFGKKIISAIKDVLGIHSPSTVFYDIGVWCVEGLINGIVSVIGLAVDAVKSLGKMIADGFNNSEIGDFTEPFKEALSKFVGFLKKFDYEKLLAIIPIGGVLLMIRQIAKVTTALANGIDGFNDILDNVAGVFGNLGKLVKAEAFKIKMEGIKQIAIAMAILVGAVVALTFIDTNKLRPALNTVLELAIILGILAFAMDKLSQNSTHIGKDGIAVEGSLKGIMGIGVALLMMAGVVKVLGSMDAEKYKQGLLGLVGLMGVMILIMAAYGKLIKAEATADMHKAGKMIWKISVAMLLLVGVAKLISSMSWGDMGKAAIGIFGLTFIIAGLVAISNLAGPGIDKMGGMLIKVAIAMVLMIGVCKLVNVLSAKDVVKGIAFAIAFAIFLGLLVRVTKIGKEQQIAKLGGLLLSVSIALGLMVGVCKLAAKLNKDEAIAGAAFVTAFIGIVWALVKITTVGNNKKLVKIGGTLIALSIAIGILAAIAVLLSLMPTEGLVKGLVAVGVLSLMMTAMIWATRGAKDVEKSIMKMAIAIGIMVAAVLLLSLIDGSKLAGATAALSSLLLCFAAMIGVTKYAKNTKEMMRTLWNMIAVTAILGVLIAGLAYVAKLTSGGSMLAAAGSLSMILLAFTGAIAILGKSGKISTTVSKQIFPMLAVAAGLALILGALSAVTHFTKDGSMLESAAALSVLLLAFSASMVVLSHTGRLSATVKPMLIPMLGVVLGLAVILGALSVVASMTSGGAMLSSALSLSILLGALAASMLILNFVGPTAKTAVGAAALMALVVGELAIILGVMAYFDVTPSMETAKALSTLLLAMSGALVILGIVGLMGPSAFIGIAALATTIVGLGALAVGIGYLMEKFPQLEEFLNKGLPLFGQIGKAIGDFIGNIAGGIIEGVGNSLPGFGQNLTDFWNNAQGFVEGVKTVDATVLAGAGYLAGAVLALTAADVINCIYDFLTFGSGFADLGTRLSDFIINATPFFENVKSLDPSVIESINTLTSVILKLTAAELISGITNLIGGNVDFSSFGTQLIAFGEAMAAFSSSITGKIDQGAVEAAAAAGSVMAEFQKSVVPTGGVVQWFCGEKDMRTFGAQLIAFGSAIVGFSAKVSADGAIDEKAIEAASKAGTLMTTLQNQIVPTGGVVQWFCGEQSFVTFGAQLVNFGQALVDFSSTVAGNLDMDAINAAETAGTMMATLQKNIPEDKWLDGKVSLDDFGKQINKYGEKLVDFSEEVDELDSSAINRAAESTGKVIGLAQKLVEYDPSGIEKFNPESLGKSIKAYGDAVAELNTAGINSSVAAAGQIMALINETAALNTSGVSSFTTAVTELGNVSIDGFVSAFSSHTAEMYNIGSSLMDQVIKGVQSQQSNLKTSISTSISGMSQVISNSMATFNNHATNLMRTFAAGIANGKSKVVSNLTATLTNASMAIRGQYTNFYTAGSYLVDGFANGISANSYKAAAKAAAMAEAAKQAAEEALGINSPSKVFFGIGDYTGQGFINGLAEYGKKSYLAGSEMADSARLGLTNAIGKITDLVNGKVDMQPTICPVMDLSNVEYGTNAINSMLSMGSTIGVSANVGTVSAMMNRRIQNGGNSDIIAALDKLDKHLDNVGNTSYNVNGITYDDGSNVREAIETIVRAARIERRT